MTDFGPIPARFVDLKRDIAASYPDFETRVTVAWNDLLKDLKITTEKIAGEGPDVSLVIVLVRFVTRMLTLVFLERRFQL